MFFRFRKISKGSICLVTYLLGFASVIEQALAAELEVRVFAEGAPIKNAIVCIGSIQQRALYAKALTNSEGVVIFKKLPEGRVVVTSNMSDRGRDKVINNTAISQNVMIALPGAKEGPVCPEL